MQASKGIFIAGAKRTPFGSFGGSLKAFTGTDLATLSSVGAMKQAKVDPSAVDAVFVGNVIHNPSMKSSVEFNIPFSQPHDEACLAQTLPCPKVRKKGFGPARVTLDHFVFRAERQRDCAA